MKRAIFLVSLSMIELSGCSAPFPTGDIATVIRDKTAVYLTDNSANFSVYGGYASSCAHPGAHAIFSVGTHNIYAVLDGVVSSIGTCDTAGDNDKYGLSIAVGMKGAVPVYFDYSIEPFGGKPCSEGDEDFFEDKILVKVGDKVTRGQKIAVIDAVTTSAHIHFTLRADGATICPDIFPASIIPGQTGTIFAGCAGASGTSLCHELTESEDPVRLTR